MTFLLASGPDPRGNGEEGGDSRSLNTLRGALPTLTACPQGLEGADLQL